MSKELPEGWVEARLEEVASLHQGFGFPKRLQGRPQGELAFYKVSDISRAAIAGHERLENANHYITRSEARSINAKPLPKDAVVFARIGEAIKLDRRALLSCDALVDNNVIGAKARTGFSDRFLFHFLTSVHLAELSQATTVPAVRTSDIAGIEVPVPPVAEQTRIVSKLDELFSRIEDGERALERARKLVERYRQSVLKAAVTGELTREWREQHKGQLESGEELLRRILKARGEAWVKAGNDPNKYKEPSPPDTRGLPELPEGWVWASLAQISHRITKGSSPKWQGFDYRSSGVLFVRSQNVGWGRLRLEEIAYLDERFNQVERKSIIERGDVLLNIVGASIGRAAVATPDVEGANSNQAVANIRLVQPELLSDFVVLFLLSPFCQSRIHDEKVDVARPNFNLNQIEDLPFALPNCEEVARIVAEVQRTGDAGDEVSEILSIAEVRSSSLRQSILKAAFSGKLVSQDPNDEPASVLLERIAAERAAASRAPERRGVALRSGAAASRKAARKSDSSSALQPKRRSGRM